MHPGGPRDGWEKQYKKTHWEITFTNDVSLALPEPLQATEADGTPWKESYVYGAGGERLSMTYLPAYDPNNGWEPTPGEGGAEQGAIPKTLWYMQDALGTTIGMVEKDGRVSSRYHYDEFGIPLDAKKFDLNWPGPDNLFGYTGLGFDYTSGLSYARARYYEPEIGRFVSENTYEGSLWSPQSQNIYAYVANNPLKYVDPSGHIPTAMEAAKMAQDIYSVTDKDKGKIVINKWKLDNIIKNDEGLKMGVYSSVKADGTTEYALVNKGTTPSKMGDWVNNIQQPFGYSDDMKDSISKSEYFVANHKNAEITMVGHSKGGAEALANAVANNKNAITFNPADPNLIQYDLSKKGYKGNATNYVVSGEILNWALGEASVGKTKYLPIQHKWTVWEFLTKGADEIIDKRIQNHSMDSVISALKGEG